MKTLRGAVAGAGLIALAAACGCQGAHSSIPVAPFSAPPATSTPANGATPSPAPSAGPTQAPTPNVGGVVNIGIPTPSPVLCSPSPLVVEAGAIAIATCAAAGYGGPISFSVADRSIAGVVLAPQFVSTYFVTGLSSGTTTLSFAYVDGGSGSLTISVTP